MPRSSPRAVLALAAAGLAALAACSGPPTIFVLVKLDAALPAVNQLSFRVDKAGSPTLGPATRPEPAGGPLVGEQSVRLSLPEAYTGTITVRIEALAAGAVVGSGTADAITRTGAETTVVVNVGPGLVCDAASCPSGCCANGVCVVGSLNLCGSGGGTCSACDTVAADRCDNGVCRCGTGAECLPGQTCVGGACRCDPSTCPSGCCSGNSCLPGRTDSQCGTAGGACTACTPTAGCDAGVCPDCAAGCDAGCCSGATCNAPGLQTCGLDGKACKVCDQQLADRCTNGDCRCGTNPPCAFGQICQGGACVCNGLSCPRGCCSGGFCQPSSAAACGTNGVACTACNPTVADSCALSGQCACGSGAPCAAPATCVGGSCRCDGGACGPPCDATTCPNGCCNGGTCVPSALATCGIGGAACVDCGLRGNSCNNGVCKCKNNAACAVGQRCVTTGAGSCACDTSSGCSGCCDGNACVGSRFQQCGANGGACAACSASTADSCTDGSCRCGPTGAACTAGQVCDAGTCV